MTAPAPQTQPRRTQAERSASTRARLLDATIECLIDLGYARTTTTVIAERAGLSRGAQLHHFPTKAALVLSAVEHLAQRQAQEFLDKTERLPQGGDRLTAVLDWVWDSFSGPLFYAALELWVAARTDPELHAIVYQFERRVGKAMAQLWHEFAGDIAETKPEFEPVLELTFHVMRGMALQKILRDDDTERRRLFEVWKRLVKFDGL